MLRPVLLVVSILLVLLSPAAGMAQVSTPQAGYDPAELLAIKPELREDVAAALPAGMTEYSIDLTYLKNSSGEGFTISGRVTALVTNTTGEPLDELPFRLYANRPSDPEMIVITAVQVDDTEVDWDLSVDNSVATVALGKTLAPDERTTITMEFTLQVPVDEPSHYGILNYSTANDTTVLVHWYPVLAGRDPLTGWMLKPVSIYGDPVFTNAAMYDVTITAPADSTFITSGVETNREERSDGWMEISYNAKPSRDFVIIESGALESTTTEHDGTTVTSWYMPNHAPAGEAVAQWTENSLAVFNPLLGEYPWAQLQAVEADVYNAAAVELPQLFIVGSSYYRTSDLSQVPGYFEFTVAHEAVHMWFYSLVGNNQYDDAFIDEGLTNYLSGDVYFREQYDERTGKVAHEVFLYRPFQRMVEQNADVIVDFPTDEFPNGGAYVSAVYTKAPLGFHALHMAMGDDAFFSALQEYVDTYRFRVATPADLEEILQAHTDADIREIWSHWFERREGGLDIRGAMPVWIG